MSDMGIQDARLPTQSRASRVAKSITTPVRNERGEVDGDLLNKQVAEWAALVITIYSGFVEANPQWGLQPWSLEWIGFLLAWGAKSSFAYNAKRKQDKQAEVEKHRHDRDSMAFAEAASRRGDSVAPAPIPAPDPRNQTMKPGQMPVLPIDPTGRRIPEEERR